MVSTAQIEYHGFGCSFPFVCWTKRKPHRGQSQLLDLSMQLQTVGNCMAAAHVQAFADPLNGHHRLPPETAGLEFGHFECVKR